MSHIFTFHFQKGMPPLPPGLPPPGQAPPLPPAADLIPQAQLIPTAAPVASSLLTNTVSPGNALSSSLPQNGGGPTNPSAPAVSLSLNQPGASTSSSDGPSSASKPKKTLKGGLTLVYDPDGDDGEELSMEERRASLARYQKSLRMAVAS